MALGLLKKECQMVIFYFAQCVRKLRYYSDVIQSLNFGAHARGLQNLVYLSVCVCVFLILALRAIRRANSSISNFSAIRA